MYARIVRASVKPGQIDEFVRAFQDSLAPGLKEERGFEQSLVLTDKDSDSITVVSLFASKADVDASEAGYRNRAGQVAHLLVSPPEASVHEVALRI